MKKLRKNKKGFTLIEVIVVLAVMAILAAMIIPTFNGFIEDAKEGQHIAEARAAYVGAQYLAVKHQRGPTPAEVDAIANVAGTTKTITMSSGDDKLEVISITWTSTKDNKDYTVSAGSGVTVS